MRKPKESFSDFPGLKDRSEPFQRDNPFPSPSSQATDTDTSKSPIRYHVKNVNLTFLKRGLRSLARSPTLPNDVSMYMK